MISDNAEGRWGYRAGPSDAMKREIGQIVTNHAGCDPALYSLFHVLSGISVDQTKVISRSLKLRANSLVTLIKAFRNENEDKFYKPLIDRIDIALAHYEKLTNIRNTVAHWQWSQSPAGEELATVSNFLSLKPTNATNTKQLTLQDLKEVSVGLIETSSLIQSVVALIASNSPNFMIDIALTTLDDIFSKVRKSLLDLPDVPAEPQT